MYELVCSLPGLGTSWGQDWVSILELPPLVQFLTQSRCYLSVGMNHTVPTHPWKCPHALTIRGTKTLPSDWPSSIGIHLCPGKWQRFQMEPWIGLNPSVKGQACHTVDGRERMNMWSAPERFGQWFPSKATVLSHAKRYSWCGCWSLNIDCPHASSQMLSAKCLLCFPSRVYFGSLGQGHHLGSPVIQSGWFSFSFFCLLFPTVSPDPPFTNLIK